MPKPTQKLDWATTPNAESTPFDPGGSYKAIGFRRGFRVAAGVLNWALNRIDSWITYIDTFESEPHTWTANQTISPGANLIVNPFTQVKHGSVIVAFNPPSPTVVGATSSGPITAGYTVSVASTSTADIFFKIPQLTGKRLISCSAIVTCNQNGFQSQATLGQFDFDATLITNTTGALSTVSVAGVAQTIAVAPVSPIVFDGKPLNLTVSLNAPGIAGASTFKITTMFVTCDAI